MKSKICIVRLTSETPTACSATTKDIRRFGAKRHQHAIASLEDFLPSHLCTIVFLQFAYTHKNIHIHTYANKITRTAYLAVCVVVPRFIDFDKVRLFHKTRRNLGVTKPVHYCSCKNRQRGVRRSHEARLCNTIQRSLLNNIY